MRWTQEQLLEHMTKFHKPIDEWDKPDPGKESVLQSKIEAWCKEWGRPYLSFHQSPKAKRMLPPGWPDMEIIMPNGQTLRMELKSSTGRLSDEQRQLRLQFLALGHSVHKVRSFKRFLELISKENSP